MCEVSGFRYTRVFEDSTIRHFETSRPLIYKYDMEASGPVHDYVLIIHTVPCSRTFLAAGGAADI